MPWQWPSPCWKEISVSGFGTCQVCMCRHLVVSVCVDILSCSLAGCTLLVPCHTVGCVITVFVVQWATGHFWSNYMLYDSYYSPNYPLSGNCVLSQRRGYDSCVPRLSCGKLSVQTKSCVTNIVVTLSGTKHLFSATVYRWLETNKDFRMFLTCSDRIEIHRKDKFWNNF